MNKKLFILLTLTLSMVLPSCSWAFSDTQGHWAEETIEKAGEYGVISGYTDNTFQPDRNMTRAELVTVIDKLLGLETETDKYIPDISSKDWYYGYFRKAMYFGIIQGDEEGNVNPERPVSREEAIVMLTRALQMETGDIVYSGYFADFNEIAGWAKKECVLFLSKQYIQGYEDNTIRPKEAVTRAEILTILERIVKILRFDISNQKVTGNVLVKEKNRNIRNTEIYGNLIIGESAAQSIQLSNVIVHGDLALYAPIHLETSTLAVNGRIINVYDKTQKANEYYQNEEYGILFSVPDGASTYTGIPGDRESYRQKDLLIVNAVEDDSNYFKTITEVSKETIKGLPYDSIFTQKAEGKIQGYPYELYSDNGNSHLLVIKRDNIVYSILMMNVVSQHLIDSVISNVIFTQGEKVKNHEDVIYKNAKLALKFTYKNGYVGVDDSYNTGEVYSGDSIFKLFIQVNLITDIENYSIEEVKNLLRTLIKNDGRIISEGINQLHHHDAIQFEIEAGEDRILSLYVIIGHNLYNFIFKGEASKVDAIGKDMFEIIANSMEF